MWFLLTCARNSATFVPRRVCQASDQVHGFTLQILACVLKTWAPAKAAGKRKALHGMICLVANQVSGANGCQVSRLVVQ